MKHPSWYQSIIIAFPFNLDAVTPDHLCMHTESLRNCRGCFSILPSCSEIQHVLSGVGRQSSAWHPAEHPFASSWAPLTVFNLLNVYISNAKHQGGSFRSVITIGEETQPRAPHLSTGSERLHHPALQENEYTVNMLTNAMNFDFELKSPSNQSLAWLFQPFKHQGIRLCISCQAGGKQGDSMAWQPNTLAQDSLHQEVSCQTAAEPPRCRWPRRTAAKGSCQWELPN